MEKTIIEETIFTASMQGILCGREILRALFCSHSLSISVDFTEASLTCSIWKQFWILLCKIYYKENIYYLLRQRVRRRQLTGQAVLGVQLSLLSAKDRGIGICLGGRLGGLGNCSIDLHHEHSPFISTYHITTVSRKRIRDRYFYRVGLTFDFLSRSYRESPYLLKSWHLLESCIFVVDESRPMCTIDLLSKVESQIAAPQEGTENYYQITELQHYCQKFYHSNKNKQTERQWTNKQTKTNYYN